MSRSPTSRPPVSGTLDLHPKTLNKRNTHGRATAYIELSAPHSVEEIDRSTIRLQETVAPLFEPHDHRGPGFERRGRPDGQVQPE